MCRSQWPRGLKRGSAAARLLRLWVLNLPRSWKFVWCECCVEVSASDWSVVQRSPTDCGVPECDHETSMKWRPWPTGGCCVVVLSKLNSRPNVRWPDTCLPCCQHRSNLRQAGDGLSVSVEKLWKIHSKLFVQECTADRPDFKINWCVTFLKLLRKII